MATADFVSVCQYVSVGQQDGMSAMAQKTKVREQSHKGGMLEV